MRCPLAFGLLLICTTAWAAPPRVVVSVMPLHSLTAAVMDGVAEPTLLLPAGSSPHDFALLPSDARALSEAELVVWIGEPLERFLAKPLARLAADARQLRVFDLPGLELLELRESGTWGGHAHETHAHGSIDPHLWLDPRNAAVIVAALAERLSALDPEHAQRYRANAETLRQRLAALDTDTRTRLAPVREVPYVVFHDAYHYFEHRYDLNAVGAVSLTPELKPGARHVAETRARIERLGARCVFSEPQFTPSLAQAVVRGTGAKLAVLDPVGAQLDPGPQAYFALLEGLRENLLACLSP